MSFQPELNFDEEMVAHELPYSHFNARELEGFEYFDELLFQAKNLRREWQRYPGPHEPDMIFGYRTRTDLRDYLCSMLELTAYRWLFQKVLIDDQQVMDQSELAYLFEIFVTKICEFTFTCIGRTTPRSRDGGIDGVLRFVGSGGDSVGIQAKYYSGVLGSEAFRTFHGSLSFHKPALEFGLLFTTAETVTGIPRGVPGPSIVAITLDQIRSITKLLSLLDEDVLLYVDSMISAVEIYDSDLGTICEKYFRCRNEIAGLICNKKLVPFTIRTERGLRFGVERDKDL